MATSLRRGGLLVVLFIGCSILSLQGADPPPAKVPAKGIDLSKMPPGSIIVIPDSTKDPLQQPAGVVLSPETYREMQEQIEQLKAKLKPEKPIFEGWCTLRGKVEGDLVHLQAQFDFTTRKPRAQVALGCKTAAPIAAVLDDEQMPLLAPTGEDGFAVQVEKPGAHRLTVDLDLAVAVRGAKNTERGFDLPLPGVATRLDYLDVPASVREVRIAGRTFAAADLSSKNDKRKLTGLGLLDKLDVAWKGPAPRQNPEPLLAADSKIDVVIDERNVSINVDLKLQVLHGQTAQWKLQIPPGLDVEVPAGDERAPVVEPPADPKSPVRIVKLKEPSSEPVQLRIRAFQQRGAGKIAIGPFFVLGAVKQQGEIKVSAPHNLRLRFWPRRDISQREVSEEQRRGNTVAVFGYWNLPQPPRETQLGQAPLDIEVETVQGGVETVTNHVLRLTAEGWQVQTEIDVRAERTELERLDVELPADYEPKAAPASLVEPELVDLRDGGRGRRAATVKLALRRGGQFKVLLLGSWPLGEEPPAGIVSIALPRPLKTTDRGGGTVKVIVPDDKELLIARENGMQTLAPGKRMYTLPTDRAPLRMEVAWREYRPELPVEMQVDLTLADRQVRVQQKLRFQFPLDALRQVMLKASDFPEGRAPDADRATLTPQGPGAWAVALKEPTLSLDYSFPPVRDKNTGAFAVPLLWPEGVTQCRTKVRIWCEPRAQPALEGGPWDELPLELVPERDSLPALVLRGSGLNVPLRLKERAEVPLPTVAVDRVLVQATVGEGGHQTYRTRFLIGKVSTHWIDVELPAPPATINLKMRLDDKEVDSLQSIDEEGNESIGGRIVRLRVQPELYRRPVILDLRYQVPPGRIEGNARLRTTLVPPRLRGNVFAGRVRWHVALPPDWVPIYTSGTSLVEQRWGFRAWLPAPRSAVSAADLERWLLAGTEFRAAGTEANLELGTRSSDVVCWQANPAPLVVSHALEPLWLLACSLTVLLTGLVLYFTSSSPRLFAALVVLLAVGVLTVGIGSPSLLPVLVYGCELGIVVLAVVGAVLWYRQRRYQRQLVFMPGFSRLAPGSSVMRGGSSHRPRNEPSTVDAQLGVLAPEPGGSRQEMVPRKP